MCASVRYVSVSLYVRVCHMSVCIVVCECVQVCRVCMVCVSVSSVDCGSCVWGGGRMGISLCVVCVCRLGMFKKVDFIIL